MTGPGFPTTQKELEIFFGNAYNNGFRDGTKENPDLAAAFTAGVESERKLRTSELSTAIATTEGVISGLKQAKALISKSYGTTEDRQKLDNLIESEEKLLKRLRPV